MIYYGFDPGKSTGVVAVRIEDKKIVPAMVPSNLDEEELSIHLDETPFSPCMFIVEGFWLEPYKNPGKTLAWDPMYASEAIGAIKHVARRNQIPIVIQKNSIKPVGYGFANQKYIPGKKGLHWQDAMAHVYYYLVTQKIGLPA